MGKRLIFLVAAGGIGVILFQFWQAGWSWEEVWERWRPSIPGRVATLSVAGPGESPRRAAYQPFGIAVDGEGTVYYSESVTGAIYRVPADGPSVRLSSRLETPSGIAVDAKGGRLIVAHTGAHTIISVDPTTGAWKTLAGRPGTWGEADGSWGEATFNGPVGVAVGEDGTIYVADTYNNRIRVLATDGQVRTLVRGDGGLLDTPCAVLPLGSTSGGAGEDRLWSGSLLIADTGQHRILRRTADGQVEVLAGSGEGVVRDGPLASASFAEPIGLTADRDGSVWVADHAGATIRRLHLGESPRVETIAGLAGRPGRAEGRLDQARFNQPAGLARLGPGRFVVADMGNGLIRVITPEGDPRGKELDPRQARLEASELRQQVAPRWPYHPPEAPRDIAGVLGEIRGEQGMDREAWFHAGLDIPGPIGETVHALVTERVARPLAVIGVGETSERVRLPHFEYVHLRVGRDAADRPLDGGTGGAWRFDRDEKGRVRAIRLRRGTIIKAGQPIGTLNRASHLHLNAGPSGAELNALLVVPLPGLRDTTPPVIERIRLTDETSTPLHDHSPRAGRREPIAVPRRLRIVVRAYDQVDGTRRDRRLGLYRLGYQVVHANGTPLGSQPSPVFNLLFDRLPDDPEAVGIAYAEGSQAGYSGRTIFDYIVTNQVRHGVAREAFLETDAWAPGIYRLRLLAEDQAGNQARQEVTLEKRPSPADPEGEARQDGRRNDGRDRWSTR
jgi:sugar lactone lactonase YvrE